MNTNPYSRYCTAFISLNPECEIGGHSLDLRKQPLANRQSSAADAVQSQPVATTDSRTSSMTSGYTMQSSVNERSLTEITSSSSHSERRKDSDDLVLFVLCPPLNKSKILTSI